MVSSQPTADAEHFLRLYTKHERHIYAFILSITGSVETADEVFQETSLVLWQKFSDFQPGTSFSAWARRIAHYKVLSYRKKMAKQALVFGDEFMGRIEEAYRALDRDFEHRREAMNGCVQRLPPADAELLKQRYSLNKTCRSIADETGRSVHTLYKSLGRIRRMLAECIQRQLSIEAHE